MKFKNFTTLKYKFLFIICISLLTLYPSFNLALFGDDWLAFVRYLYRLGPNPEGGATWSHLAYFLTPYGAQDITMGLLQKVYGYNSTLYFITSYLLRLIAALSLYPLVLYLTRNSLAAFFSVLFFSITTTGLDATNWVFNMPSYLSIIFFNIFLLCYIKSKKENNLKLLIPVALTYYLAYIIAPIRMHGILPFIFLLELFWILKERNVSTIKSSILRFITVFSVFLFISYTGESNGPPTIFKDRFSEGLSNMQSMLYQNRFDFSFYPLVIFGNAIIPYLLIGLEWRILDKLSFIMLTLPIFSIFSIILLLLASFIPSLKKKVKYILFLSLLWWLLVYFVFQLNFTTFSFAILIAMLSIGGLFLLLIINLILIYYKSFISDVLFLSLGWTFTSFIAAWWFMPTEILITTHRYLIVSAVGVSILLGSIISLGEDKNKHLSIFSLMVLILVIHLSSTRMYLKDLLSYHSQKISDKIWSAIPYIPEIGEGDEPRLFYFEGDINNQNIVHDVITFGFPPHLGLIYKYYLHYSPSNNVATNNPQDIVSAITDGKSLKAHGHQKGPISVNRIYAFKLVGQDQLINITDRTREELNKISSVYKISEP